ncbi:MAG: UPF0236 family protein [Eggerthellaceae bacterium]|nr:UPF0236 family protein [Eggerthellaceae bacterium]
MSNLTVPGAVSALSQAFSEILSGGCGSFEEFERRALEVARRSAAEAMSAALEARDRELVASRPQGSKVHSHRARTLATMTGDVRFVRAVLLDDAGSTLYPLDEELGLPMGDRVSPSMREFLVTCGADVPFERTSRLAEMGGGSRVSGTTVMRSVRRAGEAIAASEREAARALFSDGVAPEADRAAAHVLVEADGTYVTVRGRKDKVEVKAMVAYAGKEESPGGRVSRIDPVRLGCVGVAPGEFWREAVAQVGTRFDLGRVERVSLGTDGEAQYVNGISAMSFAAESDGHIDPFHVDRAVARCAPAGDRLGWALLQLLEAGGPEACAFAIDSLASVGALRAGSEKVAAYLRNHAAEIGGGPSMGTMEAEQQHTYKSRMASFPCAWSVAGADAMARTRSWISSGREVPRRTREGSLSPKRRRARDARLAALVDPTPGRRVQSDGKGWEYPLVASVGGMRADIRYEAALDLI